MITLENRFFPLRSAACFLVEGGIIVFSVVLSFLILREYAPSFPIEMQDAILRGLIVAMLCQGCMYLLDLYDIRVSLSSGELIFSIIYSTGVVCIGIGMFTYLVPELGLGGNMYYFTIAFTAVFLFAWRVAFDHYLKRYGAKENLLIVGAGRIVSEIESEVLTREKMGFRLVGVIENGQSSGGTHRVRMPRLGNYEDLVRIAQEKNVHRVIVAFTDRRGTYPVESFLQLRTSGVKVVEWQGFFEKLTGRIPIDNLAPSYFIFSGGFRKSQVVLFVRRIASALFAVALGILFFPVMLLVAAAIKIDSKGPFLYSQDRVGQRGRVFKIYKFRSMRMDAEQAGFPQWASENDPRITRVGRFIRRMRFDELPQLFNVIRGDIDLVGPRPERPEFVKELESMIPYYSLRHNVKPGLTGWAQVMFHYGSTIDESREKLQYDLFYIKNMSLKLDLFIIFRTVKILLLGRGAR